LKKEPIPLLETFLVEKLLIHPPPLSDLALQKPVGESDGPAEVLTDYYKAFPDRMKEINRSLDERRILLSCYVFGTVCSLSTKRTEGLQHTSYIDYNCQILQETAEQESDLVLVSMVRLKSVVDSAYRYIPFKGIPQRNETQAPVWMQMKSARSEIEHYWASLPPNLQQNRKINF